MFTAEMIQTIEKTIGYHFRNKGLLTQAFTRASYRNEHPGQPDNEVLELIGDSVLSLTVLTYFREAYTQTTTRGLISTWNEGKLSALKSALVSKQQLSRQMEQLNLQQYLLMSKGDAGIGIHREASVLEDLFESIIGAVYVDSDEDFTVTSAVVRRMLNLSQIAAQKQQRVHISYRNDLQEWCQDKKRGLGMPEYTETALPDGRFQAMVRIPDTDLSATGTAKNTKLACEEAARTLLALLETLPSLPFSRPAVRAQNFIGQLQEYAQARKLPLPVYAEQGDEILPDHSHLFTQSCTFYEHVSRGTAPSKNAARQKAAQKMLKLLAQLTES